MHMCKMYFIVLSHIINCQQSSGQLYKGTKCKINYKLQPINVIIDVSNSPYGHKMPVYILLKTDKIYLLKTK